MKLFKLFLCPDSDVLHLYPLKSLNHFVKLGLNSDKKMLFCYGSTKIFAIPSMSDFSHFLRAMNSS